MEPGFSLTPRQASTLAPHTDGVFLYIVIVSVVLSTATAILLIYFAIKYRRRDVDEVAPASGESASSRLEYAWSLGTLALFLTMFFAGAYVFMAWARPPDGAMEVYVVGKQWM